MRSIRDVNVRSYGAKGDGRTDDTAAFAKAMRTASGSHRRLFVPAGVYRLARLSPPDGLVMRGDGSGASWLKGHLDFGSNQTISNLKIGDAGNSAVYNRAGAHDTVFNRCRFRGGGSTAASSMAPVIALGMHNSCNGITFRDCEVERNLGTETTSNYDNCFNDISVYSNYATVPADILFEGCHVGVSNGAGGHDTGSPRMGSSATQADVSPG